MNVLYKWKIGVLLRHQITAVRLINKARRRFL